MPAHVHKASPSGAPVIDDGTFSGGRVGGPLHPVFWAWKPVDATNWEFHALYDEGNAADGFLRPDAGSNALGYRITCIMDPFTPATSLQHASLSAFKEWVEGIALGCGMDPAKLRFCCSCPFPAHVPGLVRAVLDPGLLTVRTTSNPADPIVAMALCESGRFAEHWRLSSTPPNDYKKPGANQQNSELWFWGAPEIPLATLDAHVAATAFAASSPFDYGTYDA